jgi:hypothetical protein
MKIRLCVFYGTNKVITNTYNEYNDWLGYTVKIVQKGNLNDLEWNLEEPFVDEHFGLSIEQLEFLDKFKAILKPRLMSLFLEMLSKDTKEVDYILPDIELEKIFNKITILYE